VPPLNVAIFQFLSFLSSESEHIIKQIEEIRKNLSRLHSTNLQQLVNNKKELLTESLLLSIPIGQEKR
jgi:hypothetical protein